MSGECGATLKGAGSTRAIGGTLQACVAHRLAAGIGRRSARQSSAQDARRAHKKRAAIVAARG